LAERDLRKIERSIERDLSKLLQEEIREEKRVPIPPSTKKAVYKRANGRCESCGMPLEITDKGAQFHHMRKPTVKSKPSTIQFLCAYCHRKHGHEYYTVTKSDILGSKKETKIRRKRVHRHKSPHWKTKPKSIAKKTERKAVSKKTKSKTKKTRKRPKTPSERLAKQLEKDFL